MLDWNAQRLAVLDRDAEAIIRTHARDRKVAAWLEDTAKAFEEIGEFDLAIDWAKQATDFGLEPCEGGDPLEPPRATGCAKQAIDFGGHQSRKAADYWCRLLEAHRPHEALDARLTVFRRWPSSTSAAELHQATGNAWPSYRDEVMATLASRPRDAVLFALLTCKDVRYAWDLAHSLALESNDVWSELIKAYEKVDPLAVLPIHRRLVEDQLVNTGAQHYKLAARRLAKMRKLAAGSGQAAEVDALIADLRAVHRRRPRLQQELDRARLP